MFIVFISLIAIFVVLVVVCGRQKPVQPKDITVTSIVDDCLRTWYVQNSKKFGGFDNARLFLIYNGLSKTSYYLNKDTFSIFAATVEKATSRKIIGDSNNHPLAIFEVSFPKADYPAVTAEYLYQDILAKIARNKPHLQCNSGDKFIKQTIATRVVTDTIQAQFYTNFKPLDELLISKINKSSEPKSKLSLV